MAENKIISEKQVADMRVFTVSEVELDKSGRRIKHSIIRINLLKGDVIARMLFNP